MNIPAVLVGLLVIVVTDLVMGHLVLFPLLHRGARMQPHLAIRLADTMGLVLGFVAAGWLVLFSSGEIRFWQAPSPVPGAVVVALCVIWTLVVWFAPPGPADQSS